MKFGSIVSSPREVLSPTQALELANTYLEKALKANDPYIALILCHDTEVSLSQAARSSKRFEVQGVHEDIASAYVSLGRLLDNRGRRSEAQACYKKAEKLR
jgi:tetratricopeptide (TPR) repeat protein